jgi:hypothetical protein
MATLEVTGRLLGSVMLSLNKNWAYQRSCSLHLVPTPWK